MCQRPARLLVPPTQPRVRLLDPPFFSRRTAHRTSTEGAVNRPLRILNTVQCDCVTDLHLRQLADSVRIQAERKYAPRCFQKLASLHAFAFFPVRLTSKKLVCAQLGDVEA